MTEGKVGGSTATGKLYDRVLERLRERVATKTCREHLDLQPRQLTGPFLVHCLRGFGEKSQGCRIQPIVPIFLPWFFLFLKNEVTRQGNSSWSRRSKINIRGTKGALYRGSIIGIVV